MKLKLVIAFVFALLPSAHAAALGGTPPPDPFALEELTNQTNRDTSALSFRSQTTNPAVNTLVIIAAGQSNMANVGPTAYVPTNSSVVDQLNIYDGAIRNGANPTVGTQPVNTPPPGGGNPAIQLADNLISAGNFGRVIVEPAAYVSTAVAQWDTGGALSNRLMAAYLRIVQRGIICGSTNVVCIVLWGQGESDCQNGTSQSAYTNSLNDVITNLRAAGFTVSGVAGNGLIFVAQQSLQAGTTCSAITSAQAAVVNHGAGVWAGPNADALVGSICGSGANAACRQGDNVHFTDAGVYSYVGTGSGGWRAALHAFGAPF